jgi:hypothetical protein
MKDSGRQRKELQKDNVLSEKNAVNQTTTQQRPGDENLQKMHPYLPAVM